MKSNVRNTDKIIRIILAIIIAGLGIYFHNWWGIAAIIPLGTGLINWCPIYQAIGISTCKIKK
jgi:hypothetical protein